MFKISKIISQAENHFNKYLNHKWKITCCCCCSPGRLSSIFIYIFTFQLKNFATSVGLFRRSLTVKGVCEWIWQSRHSSMTFSRILDKYLLRLELYPDLSCDSGDLVLLGKVDSDHIICLVNDKKNLKTIVHK